MSGAAHDIAAATENLGLMMLVMGSMARALVLLEQSIARFRELGDPVGTADALNNLADALLATGETGKATEFGDEALALQRDAGNALGTGNSCMMRRKASSVRIFSREKVIDP